LVTELIVYVNSFAGILLLMFLHRIGVFVCIANVDQYQLCFQIRKTIFPL